MITRHISLDLIQSLDSLSGNDFFKREDEVGREVLGYIRYSLSFVETHVGLVIRFRFLQKGLSHIELTLL